MKNTISQIKSGEIPLSRIDDAVSRILRVKLRAGIFDKPSPRNSAFAGKQELIGAKEHRDIARQAVRESLVLLKNKDNILPLNPSLKFLIAGDAANNIGKQSGGWTVTWQGTGNNNDDFPGGSSIYTGIESAVTTAGGSVELTLDGSYVEKPDVAIVVFGEEPYAEGNGDINNLDYQRGDKQDLSLLKKLKADGIPVVSVFISGRPMWVNSELNASDAFIAAWLPGSEGNGLADVIFTNADGNINHDFIGRLSFSWPATSEQTMVNRFDENEIPLLPYGFGLRYSDINILPDNLNETLSNTSNNIEDLIIFERAVKAPWQVVVASNDTNAFMTSNFIETESVAVKTMDKEVQEDAYTVTFNGKTESTFGFTSEWSKDLRAYLEQDSSLSFQIRTEESSSEALILSMNCGGSCQGDVNITEQLNTMPINTWQQLSVDLSCFVESGMNLSQVFMPLVIHSEGTSKFSISDILIKPHDAQQASISCSD